ncbi:hypothetical protein [Candidatus Vidania fulgoroideorum]
MQKINYEGIEKVIKLIKKVMENKIQIYVCKCNDDKINILLSEFSKKIRAKFLKNRYNGLFTNYKFFIIKKKKNNKIKKMINLLFKKKIKIGRFYKIYLKNRFDFSIKIPKVILIPNINDCKSFSNELMILKTKIISFVKYRINSIDYPIYCKQNFNSVKEILNYILSKLK